MYEIGGYTIEELVDLGYNCDCVEEPVLGCTDETAENYDANATLDDGTCQFTCPDGGVSVVCDGGSWQSEVSWTITDCDGNILFTGGAPFNDCLDVPADYILTMSDSYGDGWNGNTLTIGDLPYTLEVGSSVSVGAGACFVEILGCIDETACNYDSLANTDDSSCYYPEVGYNCDFEFLGCPEGTDSYTLNAYDSGNDGWGHCDECFL